MQELNYFKGENFGDDGKFWLSGFIGIEKENVRVTRKGEMAFTPHPLIFGDKLKHPYVTTDFSESQIEMITPPLPSVHDAIGFLETIHDVVSLELKDELLGLKVLLLFAF